jgi:transaldolase
MLNGTLRLNPQRNGHIRSISRAMRFSGINSKFTVLRNTQKIFPMIVRSSGEDAADPEEGEEGDYATYVFGEDDLEDEDDPSIRLYLDSANTLEWKKWAETGMFYGFTTNPTILKRDGVHCTLPSIRQLTREAFGLDVQELQLQAWGDTMAEMYSCALDLAELDTRVVVKLPVTMDGILTARRLVNDGVPVTLTAVYSVHQAVTALSLGASYVAPYLGRMNDAGKDVRDIKMSVD